MKRIDVPRGVFSNAWAGDQSIPFGMIDCPGWIKPIRRLTHKLSAINRSPFNGSIKMVNVRLSTGSYDAVSITVRESKAHTALNIRLADRALEAAKRSCARLCCVCGRPARANAGKTYCPRHAPFGVRIESPFDKRKIRRARTLLAKRIEAKVAGHMIFAGDTKMRFKALECRNGETVIRVGDAPPGARQQIIETATGEIFNAYGDEWIVSVLHTLQLDGRS